MRLPRCLPPICTRHCPNNNHSSVGADLVSALGPIGEPRRRGAFPGRKEGGHEVRPYRRMRCFRRNAAVPSATVSLADVIRPSHCFGGARGTAKRYHAFITALPATRSRFYSHSPRRTMRYRKYKPKMRNPRAEARGFFLRWVGFCGREMVLIFWQITFHFRLRSKSPSFRAKRASGASERSRGIFRVRRFMAKRERIQSEARGQLRRRQRERPERAFHPPCP